MSAAIKETMQVLSVDASATLPIALSCLADGGVLIIPTETLFGLTGDAMNPSVIKRLFAIKGREQSKQSSVFFPALVSIEEYAEIPNDRVRRLLQAYLPGPLTVVLQSRQPNWPGVVGEAGTVGVRVSSDKFIDDLLTGYGRPLIATSANKSGAPDLRTLAQLVHEFQGEVDLLCYRRKEIVPVASTVVDLTGKEPKLLRSGAISFEELLRFWKGC